MMEENTEEKTSKKQMVARVLAFSVLLLAFSVTLWLLWGNLRENVWVYYTDDANTSVGVEED